MKKAIIHRPLAGAGGHTPADFTRAAYISRFRDIFINREVAVVSAGAATTGAETSRNLSALLGGGVSSAGAAMPKPVAVPVSAGTEPVAVSAGTKPGNGTGYAKRRILFNKFSKQ